jgi:hypothetical protein
MYETNIAIILERELKARDEEIDKLKYLCFAQQDSIYLLRQQVEQICELLDIEGGEENGNESNITMS